MILFILLGILEIGIILFIQKRQRNKASKTVLIISSIIILLLFSTCVEYGFIPSDKRYVSVKGYYRSDGTYVQSYKRSYPGEKNKSAGTSYRWLFTIGIIVTALGGFYLSEYYEKNSQDNRKSKSDKTEHTILDVGEHKSENSYSMDDEKKTINIAEHESFPHVITELLKYNDLLGDNIIEPVTFDVVYDLEQYANFILAHKLYDIGCPYLIILNDHNNHLHRAIYGNKNCAYPFTYSDNPRTSYRAVPFSAYSNLFLHTLNDYKVLLYFRENNEHYCDSQIETMDYRLYYREFKSPYPYYYEKQRPIYWDNKKEEQVLFFPPEYCYIKVRHIDYAKLNTEQQNIYDQIQSQLNNTWTACKNTESYTIYRTQSPQCDIVQPAKILAFEALYDDIFKQLKFHVSQNDASKLNNLFKEMQEATKEYNREKYKTP